MGDRILSVNGVDIRDATHETAVMSLLSKADEMMLKVQHDPLPSGFQVRWSNDFSLSFTYYYVCWSTTP